MAIISGSQSSPFYRKRSVSILDNVFDSQLKAVVQGAKAKYRLSEKVLDRLYLTILDGKRHSLPLNHLLKKVERVLPVKGDLLVYFKEQVTELFFPGQHKSQRDRLNKNISLKRKPSPPSSSSTFASAAASDGDNKLKRIKLKVSNKAMVVNDSNSSDDNNNNNNKNKSDSNGKNDYDSNNNSKADKSKKKKRKDEHKNRHTSKASKTDKNDLNKKRKTTNDASDTIDPIIETAVGDNNINTIVVDVDNDDDIATNAKISTNNSDNTLSDVRSSVRQTPSNMTLEGASLKSLLPSLLADISQHIDSCDGLRSFMELLSLYDCRVIGYQELLRRAEPFLGRNRVLMNRFKQGVSKDRLDDDYTPECITYSPASTKSDVSLSSKFVGDGNASPAASSSSISFAESSIRLGKDNGTNYRWIPEPWRSDQCSGRDALCWEVLNDHYVSHPTWASEDNEFLSSQKNQFEEMLHRVDDERYLLDIEISNNWDVLTLMEGYLQQISTMPDDRKQSVRLEPEADGCSTSIYTHAIKKLYSKEKRKSIVQSLLSEPVQYLPEVVKLLRQKDTDLRKQKAEKEQGWTETVSKCYYRSLDYKVHNYKAEARKALPATHLETEIDVLWHEQQRLLILERQEQYSQCLLQQEQSTENQVTLPSLEQTLTQPPNILLLPPQLTYNFDDTAILYDIIDLMRTSYKQQVQYGQKDRLSMENFITQRLPVIFGLPPDSDTRETKKPTISERKKLKGAVQTRAQRQRQQQQQQEQQQQQQQRQQQASQPEKKQQEQQQQWLPQLDNLTLMKKHPQLHLGTRLFIGNAQWYCVVRYVQMVYESLSAIKSIDRRYKEDPLGTKRRITAQVDLDLKTKEISSVEIGLEDGYYYAALKMMHCFVARHFEQLDFEEGMRYFFGIQAYVTFNIGKTVLALIREVHNIANDATSDKLFNIFRDFEPCDFRDVASVALYRSVVDGSVGRKKKKYIIRTDGKKGQLFLHILGDDEAIFPKNDPRYNVYLETYKNRKKKTVGVDKNYASRVFLKRNLEKEDERAKSNVYLKQEMKYRICRKSYHMFYVESSEDVYVRQIRKTNRKR